MSAMKNIELIAREAMDTHYGIGTEWEEPNEYGEEGFTRAQAETEIDADTILKIIGEAIEMDRGQRDAEKMTAADMIAAITDLQQRIWGAAPELVEETVTDDGETYQALRCPTCGHLVDDSEAFWGVDVSERWSAAQPDHERQELDMSDGNDDYDSTLYYLHGDDHPHPVVPPQGWGERWV